MTSQDKREYMRNYMKKYYLTKKNQEYKMNYYERNKKKIRAQQRRYYHEHKDDPDYSHYLEHRLKKSKEQYRKNTFYYVPLTDKCNNTRGMKITRGEYLIIFD